MTPPKTIKVRIAVAVWPDNCWYASGGTGVADAVTAKDIERNCLAGYQIRWIEAEVPAYDEPVVTGEVVG